MPMQSVQHHLAVKVAAELRYVLVVGIEYRGTVGGQGLDQFVLCARDFGDRLEKLQVDGRHVGHHADLGLRDLRQGGDLSACDIPISMTAISCSGSSFSSISGRPK